MVEVDQFSKWPKVHAIPDIDAPKVVAYQATCPVLVTIQCVANTFDGICFKVGKVRVNIFIQFVWTDEHIC